MIGNYLTVALRNIIRHKLYSFINIAGLAVGLACVIFIMLFVRDELSYDTWVPDSQNLYGIESTFYMPGRAPDFWSWAPFPVAPTMQAEIPEVVAHTHLIPEKTTAQVGDRQFPVTVNTVDPNFFQTIKLPFVEGNPATALKQPESIVLSQASARKLFGTADPVGKTVLLRGSYPLTVTGIMRNLPHNTHLAIDLVIPNSSKADIMSPQARTSWLDVQGWQYIKLAPHADPAVVAAKLERMLDRHIDVRKEINVNMPGSDILHLHLTPFHDIHLAPFGETKAGRWGTVYGFAAIAMLIILIACINYVNLATVQATTRAREVSLRKVLGAKRSQLIIQFMGESIAMALVALVFALSIVEILLPAVDSLLARPITYQFLVDWPPSLAILAVTILVGALGGIYPALVLSGFRPAARLGAKASGGASGATLRAMLVVLQFAISIGLGIAVIVIFAQIRYSQKIDLGFNRHNLLVINGAGSLSPSARDSLTQALAANPAIVDVAKSGMVPFDGQLATINFNLPGSSRNFAARIANVDPNFFDVYGIRLLTGRNLSRDRGSDMIRAPDAQNENPRANILINAAAARQLGFTAATAVGHSIVLGQSERWTIVGVVGNTNFDGVKSAMQPFVYFYNPKFLGVITVRVRPGHTQAALAAVDNIWHRFVPTVAIRHYFQDASFDKLFADDERQGMIFSIFVAIAISIACLGLFGLASFTAERRTKEIGIRKVFGARTGDIVRLLLMQFTLPVVAANFIAWPVAWYYLHRWLEGYSYRIALSPLYFLSASVIALLIAWVTVIFHTILVARARPMLALRYE